MGLASRCSDGQTKVDAQVLGLLTIMPCQITCALVAINQERFRSCWSRAGKHDSLPAPQVS